MDNVAHWRELSNGITMPLLFKNGKLVVNDIDQLVFSEDPDSCRCCPGACDCTPGSEYELTGPKYLEDVSFSFSNVQDTYSEEVNVDETVQWSDGFVDRFILERSFEISGISALNGTHPLSLKSYLDLETDCLQPDPFPPCPLNANPDCVWTRKTPTAPITGVFRNRQYLRRNGIVETDIDQTLYITGWAIGFPSQWKEGLTSQAQIWLSACIRRGSYSGDGIASLTMYFNWYWSTAFRDDIVPGIRSQNRFFNDHIRIDCTETVYNPSPFNRFFPSFPPSVLPRFDFSSVICGNEPSYFAGSVQPVWCNDYTLLDTEYSIEGCTGSNSLTTSVPPPVVGGGRGYDAVQTSNYTYSGYAFDSAWNYTLDPP